MYEGDGQVSFGCSLVVYNCTARRKPWLRALLNIKAAAHVRDKVLMVDNNNIRRLAESVFLALVGSSSGINSNKMAV